jgi:hypothetical protein
MFLRSLWVAFDTDKHCAYNSLHSLMQGLSNFVAGVPLNVLNVLSVHLGEEKLSDTCQESNSASSIFQTLQGHCTD